MSEEFARHYRDASFAAFNPPPPIILSGSLRRGNARQVFVDAIGRVPDIALVIGGNRNRTRVFEEAESAKTAGIPAGIALNWRCPATVGSTLSIDAEQLKIITDLSRPLGSGDLAVCVLDAFRWFANNHDRATKSRKDRFGT